MKILGNGASISVARSYRARVRMFFSPHNAELQQQLLGARELASTETFALIINNWSVGTGSGVDYIQHICSRQRVSVASVGIIPVVCRYCLCTRMFLLVAAPAAAFWPGYCNQPYQCRGCPQCASAPEVGGESGPG